MTKEELNQLYWLKKEAAQLQRELSELQQTGVSVTSSISGTPGSGSLADKTADFVSLKMLLEKRLEAALLGVQYEHARLEDYISGVKDSEMRLILRLRHVNGMSWECIGEEIGYTKSGVCRKYHRFLASVNQFNAYM